MTGIKSVAEEAAKWFEVARRDEANEDSEYTRLKDGAPEWVRELVYTAHGEFGPDDWRYDTIRCALLAIEDWAGEDDGGDFADSQVDIYTAARFAWLASNLNRQGYIEEAVSDLGMTPTADVGEMIGWGQYMEASEVFGLVFQAISERVEEQVSA